MTQHLTLEPSREFAKFAAAAKFADLPPFTVRTAQNALINWLGCTIAGARHEATEAAINALRELGTSGSIQVLGRQDRLDAPGWALVSGIASAVLDFDSTQLKRTNIHPSGPVLAALLALSATRPIPGQDFLTAYVVGVEVACRIANAVFGERNPGWHVTGATGGIGAAVAAGKALGFTVDQHVAAIAIAVNQTGGLREMYGTACKALTPGRAGQSGLLAALMARHGFSAPAAPLEGPKGFVRVFSGGPVPLEMTSDLGQPFEIDLTIFKPYPCAIVTHAVIDGVSRIAQSANLSGSDIAAIELSVAPIAIELAGKLTPTTELESKFSLSHAAAVAAVHRTARVEHFSDEALADPLLQNLRGLVRVQPAPGFRKDEAAIRLTKTDGSELSMKIDHAWGSLEHPMGDEDVRAKFLVLARPVIGTERCNKMLEACAALERPGTGTALIA